MLKRHHTFRYVIARVRQMIYEYRYPDHPWLTRDAIQLLSELIRSNDRGLEFGSGRSTLWLARRCQYLVSIEHDPGWYEKVNGQVSQRKNVSYQCLNVHADRPEDSAYVRYLDRMEAHAFDVILIDGKHRDVLCLFGLDKLRPGGLMVLDNAERYLPNALDLPESIGSAKVEIKGYWKEFHDQTATWRRIWTTNGVSATLILFKP